MRGTDENISIRIINVNRSNSSAKRLTVWLKRQYLDLYSLQETQLHCKRTQKIES